MGRRIKPPNTKWVFVKFSNIDVKEALNGKPLLGTGVLLNWLCIRAGVLRLKMISHVTLMTACAFSDAWLFTMVLKLKCEMLYVRNATMLIDKIAKHNSSFILLVRSSVSYELQTS